MPRDNYQTVKEVADRLHLNEATVRGWIRTGALRAIEIGKGWRIADSDLQRFLSDHATRPRTQTAPDRGPGDQAASPPESGA